MAGCSQEEINRSSAVVQRSYEIYRTSPEFELYDLEHDPFEFTNLVGDPAHQSLLEEMKASLKKVQLDAEDPFGKADNVNLWIDQERMGRNTNYRKENGFKWPYLQSFRKD